MEALGPPGWGPLLLEAGDGRAQGQLGFSSSASALPLARQGGAP